MKGPGRRIIVSAVLLLGAAAVLLARDHQAVVVVHPATSIDSVAKTELSRIFLKRLRTWEDGTPANPVDQVPESAARRSFTRWVHGRAVMNIEIYWKRMIFSGKAAPPPELVNDRAVLDYVRSTPGAVGYVLDGESLEGVRRLSVR